MYRYKKVAGCIYTPCDLVDGLGGVRLDVTGVFRRQSAAVVCGNRSPGTGLCNSDLMCFFSELASLLALPGWERSSP